jgi:hypothetical protein
VIHIHGDIVQSHHIFSYMLILGWELKSGKLFVCYIFPIALHADIEIVIAKARVDQGADLAAMQLSAVRSELGPDYYHPFPWEPGHAAFDRRTQDQSLRQRPCFGILTGRAGGKEGRLRSVLVRGMWAPDLV